MGLCARIASALFSLGPAHREGVRDPVACPTPCAPQWQGQVGSSSRPRGPAAARQPGRGLARRWARPPLRTNLAHALSNDLSFFSTSLLCKK